MKVKIGCDNCQEYEMVIKGSNAHKVNLCHGCFQDIKETTIERALRQRFDAHGIPYDEIDPEMVELLDVLNFELGLRTKYCCYGHEERDGAYVIFHESVTDEQIMKLAEQTGQDFASYIVFDKWVRWHPVMVNWKMRFGRGFKNPDSESKKLHLDGVVKTLRTCEV